MIDINKTTAKYLVLDLTTFEMREEENGPMEDPAILNDDKCKTTELWLRRIEPGTFLMGSPEGEIGRRDDEEQHEVTLNRPFYIGVFQVTQKQYELIAGDNPSYFKGDTRPVESISYYLIRRMDKDSFYPSSDEVGAESFLGKLRSRCGMLFDLPTEFQWEYACRAGSKTAWNNGTVITSEDSDSNLDKLGRYYFNSGADDENSCVCGAHATVGSYLPNTWGLYDMHGNVWEWCLKNSNNPVTDPKGAIEGEYYVLRGGGWDCRARDCRSAKRFNTSPGRAYRDRGFRVVLIQE